jgi:hypothetical protein
MAITPGNRAEKLGEPTLQVIKDRIHQYLTHSWSSSTPADRCSSAIIITIIEIIVGTLQLPGPFLTGHNPGLHVKTDQFVRIPLVSHFLPRKAIISHA